MDAVPTPYTPSEGMSEFYGCNVTTVLVITVSLTLELV